MAERIGPASTTMNRYPPSGCYAIRMYCFPESKAMVAVTTSGAVQERIWRRFFSASEYEEITPKVEGRVMTTVIPVGKQLVALESEVISNSVASTIRPKKVLRIRVEDGAFSEIPLHREPQQSVVELLNQTSDREFAFVMCTATGPVTGDFVVAVGQVDSGRWTPIGNTKGVFDFP